MTITRTVNGTCHHDCPDSCGWTVTVEGDGAGAVAVKLRGNAAHPFSAGELCPKVNRFLDRVYSTDRIAHPAPSRRTEGLAASSNRSRGPTRSPRSPNACTA